MNILLITLAFAISLVCGFIAIPVILDYCKSKRLYDIPNARKVHKSLIPRLGGVAFMPSMLLAFMIAIFLWEQENHAPKVEMSLWSLYFLIGLLLIYATGVVDDLIGLSANIKFVVQILAAIILPMAGLYLNNLDGLFGLYEIPFWLGAPLTVFIIVFVCNAMNLIDGIDGLSASLSEIALLGFLMAFFREGMFVYCVLIAGLMGVLVAYLYFNVFGKAEKNRKIFMGDSGSLTLGFILSFLFVKLSMDNPHVMHYDPINMPFAYSLLLVPTFDVVRVVIHRIRTHRPLFDADKNHIHHKLMRMGLTMHQTLFAILGIAVAFLIINYALYTEIGITVMFVADIALYTLLALSINSITYHKIKEERIS